MEASMRKTAVLVIAVAAIWSAGTAQAQGFDVPPGRWWEVPRLVEDLGLTAEQRGSLAEATRTHVRKLADLRAEVTKAQVDLQVAAEKEPFSPREVRQAFGVLQAARSRLELERFELVVSVRGVLSSSQWRTLQDIARRRMEMERSEGGRRPGLEGRRPLLRRPQDGPPRGSEPPQGDEW